MRIIVTGGTGFIGRALVELLHTRGHEVVVLSRSLEKVRNVFGDKAVPARWDGESAEGWGDLAEGAGAIVNLAGENISQGLWTEEKKQRIRQSRIQAGAAVTAAVAGAKLKPEAVVQSSAVGFYGDRDDPVDETAPPGEGFLAEVCVEWEASTAPVEEMGVRRAVARTGVVLGRGGGVLEKLVPPFRLFLGGPLGDGRQGFSWIGLEDQVRALAHLAENPESSGPYNLSAPEPVENREFARQLARALNRPSILRAPKSALRLVFGEMAQEVLLAGQFAKPSRLLSEGFHFHHPRLEVLFESLFR